MIVCLKPVYWCDVCCACCLSQIYFYFYSLLRAVAVSAFRARRGLPAVKAGSTEARTEDIGVPASLLVAAVAGAINMFCTSPAQVQSQVFRVEYVQNSAG